jgi:large subunit ribosomal protein L25
MIMKTSFELVAEFRETQGKGASRRLRHEGKVPAILYGGHSEARMLTLSHQKLQIMLDNERFFSTILNLKVGDQTQAAILKDVQRHPYKNAIVHIDFQRVEDNQKIRMSIPLHFVGAAVSPGIKSQGGIVAHMRNEVEVSCLPKDLPEFIEVDLSGLSLNESIHLSQLKIPDGVELLALSKEDAAVVAIHSPRAEEVEATPGPARRRRRLQRRRQQRRPAMRRRRRNLPRRMRKRRRRRKTPRSSRLLKGSVPRRAVARGGPRFFMALRGWVSPRWLDYHCALSSVSAIRGPNIR